MKGLPDVVIGQLAEREIAEVMDAVENIYLTETDQHRRFVLVTNEAAGNNLANLRATCRLRAVSAASWEARAVGLVYC